MFRSRLSIQIFIIIALLLPCFVSGQQITWQLQDLNPKLPTPVKFYAGERASPPLRAWYVQFAASGTSYRLVPYLSQEEGGLETTSDFARREKALLAVNGGYFDSSTGASFSTVVRNALVYAQNIKALNRGGTSYPVTRSALSIDSSSTVAINWIYHFGTDATDIRSYAQPAQNRQGAPAAVPDLQNGSPLQGLQHAIGGGPTLVRDGKKMLTCDEEVFWGSGVGRDVRNPRTAVGVRANGEIILLVADGRQTASEGLTLPELADVMLSLDCASAMNLDGGGSSTMVIRDSLVNRPEGGSSERAVASILALVHRDSLAQVSPDSGLIIDTGDEATALIGDGWFASANSGFWGTTPSLLNTRGDGSRYAQFETAELSGGRYHIEAWWVAAFNRCKDTPFVISHADGIDTVRLDQSRDGSSWQAIGTYSFRGDSTEFVRISNLATTGEFIVADAVRFTPAGTVSGVAADSYISKAQFVEILGSAPNPFSETTTIRYRLMQPGRVMLEIYNLLGRQMLSHKTSIANRGNHSLRITPQNWPAGMYLYTLLSGTERHRGKLLYLR